ncbi:hypothetical protein D3C85_1431800 [compost metagenome]
MRLLKHYATQATDGKGRRMIDDVRMRDKIARLEMDLMAMEMLLLRVATQEGGRGPGPEASILKIRGPNAWPYAPAWREAGVVQPVSGPDWASPAAASYFDMRKTSIYGGANEVQKNIIAKMIIGF